MPKKTPQGPPFDPASSFTRENFEKELKELAAKAREETLMSNLREQLPAYLRPLLYLILAAVSANASVAALSPVYGGIPSATYHSSLVYAACFVGWASNLLLQRLLPDGYRIAMLLPLAAAYLPAVQFYLMSASGSLTAQWGPLVTETLTLFPLLVGTVACVATDIDAVAGLDGIVRLPRWIADGLPGIVAYLVFKFAEKVTTHSFLVVTDRQSALYLVSVAMNDSIFRQSAVAAVYAFLAPSRLLWLTLPALLHSSFFNVHFTLSPLALNSLNQALASKAGSTGLDTWVVLDRQTSVTGYISVIENQSQGYRALRCDHSLLGGEWLNFPINPVAEPIYGVFVMLEAVRLMNVPRKIRDSDASALVIGLGIGTAPAALIAHGINTTVVELDPVVHDFAGRYFHLPKNHISVIEDAVSFTKRVKNETGGAIYDYIVHDVFTGGAEPIPLFTLEFLRSLRALLKPSGVIAINYAGDFAATPIKAVMHTIRTVFPACRIFREHSKEQIINSAGETTEEGTGLDFVNVVVFCTKDGSPVSFREPSSEDFLNSMSRQHYLVPKHEVVDADFLSSEKVRIVRNNDTEQLAKWHDKSALGHWNVMRQVVPPEVWVLW